MFFLNPRRDKGLPRSPWFPHQPTASQEIKEAKLAKSIPDFLRLAVGSPDTTLQGTQTWSGILKGSQLGSSTPPTRYSPGKLVARNC